MPLTPTTPVLIPEPFAQNAGADFIQNPIPETTGSAGRASYDQGWPAQTMQPVVAGGVPPWGQDFNGLMFAVTNHLYWTQAGRPFQFNADVAAAIGGYSLGTILASDDGQSFWMNSIAGNTTDPDGGAGIAAGWLPLACTIPGALGGLAAGNYGVPDETARCGIIVLSGTLSGNVNVIFPEIIGEWLLVNNCTVGAFTVRASTAGGGVSVNVPAGGFGSPLGVYSIGDGNMYPSVSPLGVPISIAAAPLTLVERDGNSNVFANVYNSLIVQDNLGISSVWYETAGDGYIRKMALASLEGQMNLAAIGGQVTPGQVPVAAVTQYSPQILASATLTGTPSVPTQSPGTSNTTPASTAFVNPGSSLNPNGYRKNPDGSIDQWGSFTTTANAGVITGAFNIPFPTACYQFDFTVIAPGGTGGAGSRESDCSAAPTTNNFFIRQAASSNTAITIQWRAIGK